MTNTIIHAMGKLPPDGKTLEDKRLYDKPTGIPVSENKYPDMISAAESRMSAESKRQEGLLKQQQARTAEFARQSSRLKRVTPKNIFGKSISSAKVRKSQLSVTQGDITKSNLSLQKKSKQEQDAIDLEIESDYQSALLKKPTKGDKSYDVYSKEIGNWVETNKEVLGYGDERFNTTEGTINTYQTQLDTINKNEFTEVLKKKPSQRGKSENQYISELNSWVKNNESILGRNYDKATAIIRGEYNLSSEQQTKANKLKTKLVDQFQTYRFGSGGLSAKLYDRHPDEAAYFNGIRIPYYTKDYKELRKTATGYEIVSYGVKLTGSETSYGLRKTSKSIKKREAVNINDPEIGLYIDSKGYSTGGWSGQGSYSSDVAAREKDKILAKISSEDFMKDLKERSVISVGTSNNVNWYNPITGKGATDGNFFNTDPTKKRIFVDTLGQDTVFKDLSGTYKKLPTSFDLLTTSGLISATSLDKKKDSLKREQLDLVESLIRGRSTKRVTPQTEALYFEKLSEKIKMKPTISGEIKQTLFQQKITAIKSDELTTGMTGLSSSQRKSTISDLSKAGFNPADIANYLSLSPSERRTNYQDTLNSKSKMSGGVALEQTINVGDMVKTLSDKSDYTHKGQSIAPGLVDTSPIFTKDLIKLKPEQGMSVNQELVKEQKERAELRTKQMNDIFPFFFSTQVKKVKKVKKVFNYGFDAVESAGMIGLSSATKILTGEKFIPSIKESFKEQDIYGDPLTGERVDVRTKASENLIDSFKQESESLQTKANLEAYNFKETIMNETNKLNKERTILENKINLADNIGDQNKLITKLDLVNQRLDNYEQSKSTLFETKFSKYDTAGNLVKAGKFQLEQERLQNKYKDKLRRYDKLELQILPGSKDRGKFILPFTNLNVKIGGKKDTPYFSYKFKDQPISPQEVGFSIPIPSMLAPFVSTKSKLTPLFSYYKKENPTYRRSLDRSLSKMGTTAAMSDFVEGTRLITGVAKFATLTKGTFLVGNKLLGGLSKFKFISKIVNKIPGKKYLEWSPGKAATLMFGYQAIKQPELIMGLPKALTSEPEKFVAGGLIYGAVDIGSSLLMPKPKEVFIKAADLKTDYVIHTTDGVQVIKSGTKPTTVTKTGAGGKIIRTEQISGITENYYPFFGKKAYLKQYPTIKEGRMTITPGKDIMPDLFVKETRLDLSKGEVTTIIPNKPTFEYFNFKSSGNKGTITGLIKTGKDTSRYVVSKSELSSGVRNDYSTSSLVFDFNYKDNMYYGVKAYKGYDYQIGGTVYGQPKNFNPFSNTKNSLVGNEFTRTHISKTVKHEVSLHDLLSPNKGFMATKTDANLFFPKQPEMRLPDLRKKVTIIEPVVDNMFGFEVGLKTRTKYTPTIQIPKNSFDLDLHFSKRKSHILIDGKLTSIEEGMLKPYSYSKRRIYESNKLEAVGDVFLPAKQLKENLTGVKEIPLRFIKKTDFKPSRQFDVLYHGTSSTYLKSINAKGLIPPKDGLVWTSEWGNYARLKALEAATKTQGVPVILKIKKTPDYVLKKGRHLVKSTPVPKEDILEILVFGDKPLTRTFEKLQPRAKELFEVKSTGEIIIDPTKYKNTELKDVTNLYGKTSRKVEVEISNFSPWIKEIGHITDKSLPSNLRNRAVEEMRIKGTSRYSIFDNKNKDSLFGNFDTGFGKMTVSKKSQPIMDSPNDKSSLVLETSKSSSTTSKDYIHYSKEWKQQQKHKHKGKPKQSSNLKSSTRTVPPIDDFILSVKTKQKHVKPETGFGLFGYDFSNRSDIIKDYDHRTRNVLDDFDMFLEPSITPVKDIKFKLKKSSKSDTKISTKRDTKLFTVPDLGDFQPLKTPTKKPDPVITPHFLGGGFGFDFPPNPITPPVAGFFVPTTSKLKKRRSKKPKRTKGLKIFKTLDFFNIDKNSNNKNTMGFNFL